MSLIRTEKLGKSIVRATFDRPEKLNAFTIEMYEEFSDIIEDVEQDDDVKVLILRGAGSSFCSGQDLTEVGVMYGFGDSKDTPRPSQRRRLAIDRKWAGHYQQFTDCSKLTISQIHGHCLGTGFEFMMQSDFAIASHDANLGHPGLRLVGPGLNFNTAYWLWYFGPRLAKELMFTGRTLTGKEAVELGIINESHSEEELDERAKELAEQLCLMPADGIVMGKEALRMSAELLGVRGGFVFGAMSHTFNTNAKFDPGEFNFFKERREVGAKQAFHERDRRYEEASGQNS
jgi:enoyl-CoA hydratase/carnithine racemase